MSKIDNSNYNKVSIKTDSMVKMIDQLAKLGVFKEKRKPRAKKTTVLPDSNIRQEGSMPPGYVRTIGVPQITPGMNAQQIQDIQERTNAIVANLRGEVEQQRLADIEAQQGQRFSDIERFGTILNPVLERFRGSQSAGAGQRLDPFAVPEEPILIPDIQEETFTQTLNEGGPEATPAVQTQIFAGEEEQVPAPRLQPVERIAPFNLSPNIMTEIDVYWGFGKIPESRSVGPLRDYLRRINQSIGSEYATNVNREELLKNIRSALREAYTSIPEKSDY